MLLLDGHASHISTRTIQYCVDQKIILLCLPPHTTHILQPLDVGIFAALATKYKNNVHRITRQAAGYLIDKSDFLKQLRRARNDVMIRSNIEKAWAASGLEPFDPYVILKDFPTNQTMEKATPNEILPDEEYHISISRNRPHTPPEAIITCAGPHGSKKKVLTPGNTLQVHQLIKQMMKDREDPKVVAQKVSKSCVFTIANEVMLRHTNAQLMDIAQRKDSKKKRRKGHFTGGRVMNQEVLDERREIWDWDTIWKSLAEISRDVFGRQKIKKTRV